MRNIKGLTSQLGELKSMLSQRFFFNHSVVNFNNPDSGTLRTGFSSSACTEYTYILMYKESKTYYTTVLIINCPVENYRNVKTCQSSNRQVVAFTLVDRPTPQTIPSPTI